MAHIPLPVPINLNPPLHGKYRLPLNPTFSPKAMVDLKDGIRALARELIARIAPLGRCEFMSTVAEPMPVQVFLKMLGLPLERQAEYRALVKEHLASIADTPQESMLKLRQIADTMRPTFEARRREPQDDIISLLWKTEIDGQPTTMADLENYGVLLFIAGLDTVMNGIGIGVRHLALHPELQVKVLYQRDYLQLLVKYGLELPSQLADGQEGPTRLELRPAPSPVERPQAESA